MGFVLTSVVFAACISMALGLAILSFVPAAYGYAGVLCPFLLVAAAAGPGFTLLNTAGLAAVSSERSGQATGIIYMFRFGGGAIGVATASALHDALFHKQLVFRLSETPLSFAQQKLLEQPGALNASASSTAVLSGVKRNKSATHSTNRSGQRSAECCASM